jgi:hypothetical protein
MITLACTTIAIALLLALMLIGTIIGARAVPAFKSQEFFLCGDTAFMALVYENPKTAGTPVDFIILGKPGKPIRDGIHEIRVKNGEVFVGDTLCKPAKITLCPIEEGTC